MHDDFYQMYLEELSEIIPCGAEEMERLAAALAGGDDSVKPRMIEGRLHRALELAKEYADRGLPVSDLVQEANVALTQAVESYLGEPVDLYLDGRMREALEEALRQQDQYSRAGKEVAVKANVLQEVARRMAEELGREATLEELAERMKMDREEIRNLMKITLDALSIYGGE